jgi:hypothetical protein
MASDTALSCIIAFIPDLTAHKWTTRKIAQAITLLESGEMNCDNAAIMMGCKEEVARTRLTRPSEPNEGQTRNHYRTHLSETDSRPQSKSIMRNFHQN